MGAEARSVVVRLSMDAAQYIAQAQKVGTLTEGAMVKAEAATRKQSAAMDDLGRRGGKAALVAGAGLAFLAKSAVDFESQFAGVEKTVDGTSSQLADLEGELRGLATTMPATHKEILGVAEAAGQLGVAREDISDFTETMVQLGETTNLTAQDAATSIAQMANVMQTAPEDIERVGSALVALGNDGASTEAQILGMAQRIAGAGAQIGLAESDILAIANAASSMGIEVEAGGSAISRVFTELAKATAQGGADLEAFAAVAGMSGDEFTRAFQDDPAQAFAAFTAGLDQINKSGGDVFTTLDQLGLADVRVSQALLGMAASGDLLTDSLALGATAWDDNSALAEEYAKRLDTTASDARIAWNQIKDAGIEAGTVLLPILSKAAGVVGDLAGAFQSLPDPVQDSLTSMLAITAVLGGSLWFGSKVVGGIANTKASLAELGATAATTQTALSGLGKGIEFALILGGIDLVQTKIADLFDDNFEESTLSRNLEALGRGEIVDNLDKIGEKVFTVNAALAQGTDAAFGWLPGDTDLEAARTELEKIDTTLAAMVEGGKGTEAAAIFAEIVEQSRATGTSLNEIIPTFGQYQLAVDNAASKNTSFVESVVDTAEAVGGRQVAAAEANAAAWDAVVRATAAGGEQAGATASQIDALTAAMRAETSAALGAFDATTAWGAAVIAAREQAKTGEQGLNELTEAGQHNREKLSQLAAAWAEQPKAVRNSEGAYRNARQTFLEVADAMGVGDRKARQLANSLLEVPRKTVAKIEADDRQARNAIDDVDRGLHNIAQIRAQATIDAENQQAINAINETKRFLGLLDGDSATTYIYTVRQEGQGFRPPSADGNIFTYASGGMDRRNGHRPEFAGPGPTRVWREPETGGESYIPHANDGRRPRAKSILEQTASMFGGQVQWFAQGGIIGAGGPGDMDHLLRTLQALAEKDSQIADLRQDTAEKDSAYVKKRNEVREALQGVASGFSLDSLVPTNRPESVERDAQEAIRQFRRDILDAGGEWTKGLRRWSKELIAAASELDDTRNALERETRKRDRLTEQLDEQTALLEDLNQTMEAFSNSVASNFLPDLFNQATTSGSGGGFSSSGGGGGGGGSHLIPDNPQIAAAEAELAAIRASTIGTSVEAAAVASRLIARIAELRAAQERAQERANQIAEEYEFTANAQNAATEQSISGLQALEQTLTSSTASALAFTETLTALVALGLDPAGGLFQQLALSGDVATAQELAGLSPEEIDHFEALFQTNQDAAAAAGAFATQAAYGKDHAVLVAAVGDLQGAVDLSNATMTDLSTEIKGMEADIRHGAKDGVAALQPQIDELKAAINRLAPRIAELIQNATP